MDAETFRDTAHERWERAARGWERRRAELQSVGLPVSEWMIDHARLQPGHTVLELAAGPGDTGLLAARRIAPDGRLISTDHSEAMIEVARRRAQELGIENADFRIMGAEWIDLPAASVDAVLARWGYMLLADPEAALRETRRVLRPGGRVALAAWDAAELNPTMSTLGGLLVEKGLVERPEPGEPGPFAFAVPGRIEELLDAAGFDDIEVDAVDITFAYGSPDEYFEQQTDLSTRAQDAFKQLSPAEHTRFRDELDERLATYARPDGTLELPGRTLVAAASA